jgi:predicted transposase YbfD/YdcC
MSAPLSLAFFDHFRSLQDHRMKRTQLHNFGDILFIAVCATICGANAFTEMEEFGRAKQDWLKKYLELPNGIPSHDTFRNVISAINPAGFTECFLSWVKSLEVATAGKIVSIDGKTSRASGSPAKGQKPLHMVSAWATENRLVLGQVATDEKSNEITAIPELLKVLELHGAIVTIDSMGCQKAIAADIRDREGHYVLQVKGNQEHLEQDIIQAFSQVDEAVNQGHAVPKVSAHETNEKGHGREDYRRCEAMPVPEWLRNLAQWKDLCSIVRVTRVYKEKGVDKSDVRYFISSLEADAKRLSEAVRQHWGVENGLHWSLDMMFGDDLSRARTDHAATNLGILRRWILSLLRQDKKHSGGFHAKRLQMGWNEKYLESILGLK